MLLNSGSSKTKFRTSDVRFKPLKNWLGGTLTERVDGWDTQVLVVCFCGVWVVCR